MNEVDLLCAVVREAFKDLTKAYKYKDEKGIIEGEWFFLSGESLFDCLDLDGKAIVEVARKRARK